LPNFVIRTSKVIGCSYEGCQACAGSDHHQAHFEVGRSRSDWDDSGPPCHQFQVDNIYISPMKSGFFWKRKESATPGSHWA